MAHIPYGYKITMGGAVIDPEAAEQVREFFRLYNSGLSINKAKEEAGIPVAYKTANDMLQRERYLGDEYYPAIIDQETFDKAAEERARRVAMQGKKSQTKPKDAIPVKTKFTVVFPEETPQNMTPAQRAAFLYSLITPDPDGTETADPADRAILRGIFR